MGQAGDRVFISYRRDDAAGYAGRLEDALERRLGRGSVFRDVLDIAPGEDFVAAIRSRLAGARTVLVLIGPRWAGPEASGRRRIDDDDDFVRLEVSTALGSSAQVVPVLLPGAAMPSEESLPAALKPLARRNALSLSDTSWDADVDRLAAHCGASRRPAWPWLLAGASAAALLVGGWCWLRPPTLPDIGDRLLGSWEAEVRYDWGDRYAERFEFKRHAGELTGTATFLRYPRAIEDLQLQGTNLRFQTHSTSTMGDVSKEVTRQYAAELRGQPPDEVLAFRMESRGGFSSERPIEFEARRVPAGGAPASTASAPTR